MITKQDAIDLLRHLEFDTSSAILISIAALLLYGGWVGIMSGFSKANFTEILPVCLSTYSILAGIRVILFGIENTAHSMDGTQQFYIAIGGCAVIANACKTIRKMILSHIKPKP